MNKMINKTSYQVLITLIFIMQNNNFCISDLIIYAHNKYNIILSKETALKYIRTLKTLGFEFKKSNNRIYKLTKIPFSISISKDEKTSLTYYIKMIEKYSYANVFSKLSLFIPECKILKSEKNKTNKKIEKLEKYCHDKLHLQIEVSQKKQVIKLTVEPDKIYFYRTNLYLKCYDLNKQENILINIDNIMKIKQTPIKNKFSFKENYVKLKLQNNFAKAYTLKNGEKIIEKNEKYHIIKSFYYDKTLFFNNILRYMDKCEIIAPQKLRNDFYEYITALYEQYSL